MNLIPGRAARILAILAIAGTGLVAPTAGAAGQCMTPTLMSFATPHNGAHYSAGAEAEIAWFGDVAGGYRVQAATDPAFSSSSVVYDRTFGPSADTAIVKPLAERAHWFRVRAQAKTGTFGCSASEWSNTVTIIQDATAPSVAYTTQTGSICGVPLSSPTPIFCREADVRITGTASDPAGGSAPSGSGATGVAVTLVNTTPVVGAATPPVIKTAGVDTDGTWLARYAGADKPLSGIYSVQAQGIDRVGNIADDPVELAIIVVA